MRRPAVTGRGRAGRGRRPGTSAGRDRPEKVRPGAKRISPALRRLVVTPTFAAGLGVVVAAFLAANMSRTVLHFSAPIPGNQCTAGDCHAQAARRHARLGPPRGAHHAQRPGRLRPGHRGPARRSQPRGEPAAVAASRAAQRGQPAAGRAGPRGRGQRRPQPSVGSRAGQRHLPAGRAVAGRLRRPDHDPRAQRDQEPQAWSLAFAYPGARIAGVQGARWEPGRAGAGVAQGVSWPGWGQAQHVRGPGAAHGHRGGPARRAVRLRLRRAALHVRAGPRPQWSGVRFRAVRAWRVSTSDAAVFVREKSRRVTGPGDQGPAGGRDGAG